MTRPVDPDRRCLRVEDWPQADQALWQGVMNADDLESEMHGAALRWRTSTVGFCRLGYGRWINFCQRSGFSGLGPADRATPERVAGYLGVLRQQGKSLHTQCNRLMALHMAISAFVPDRDWTWLMRLVLNVKAQLVSQKRRRDPPILAGDILDRCRRAMTRLERAGAPRHSLVAATEYRDWLMVCMLTLVPLRVSNFGEISITRHMQYRGSSWLIEVPASETKTATPLSMPIPDTLNEHLAYYVGVVRPHLLGDRGQEHLWISKSGSPMSPTTIWHVIVKFTVGAFGVKINPHLFRHIAATSTVLAAPDKVDAARALLGHSNSRTTRDYYVLGSSVAASRRHAALISRLRSSGPGAKRDPGILGGR